MSYVLVTGCNGFIGNKVTNELLKQGYKVLGLSTRLNYQFQSENFKYIKADITDCLTIEKVFNEYNISSVIHLAGLAHVKKGQIVDWNKHTQRFEGDISIKY